MHDAFEVHMLNLRGKELAQFIAATFDECLVNIETLCGGEGREMAIVRTKLEEACFFAKKAMANKAENQEGN